MSHIAPSLETVIDVRKLAVKLAVENTHGQKIPVVVRAAKVLEHYMLTGELNEDS